jgi:NAD(P)-dependent dehydrogenase (short-subunit alcohol dehydrogenase family)
MFKLNNKVCIVTGSSRGIGKAVATAFASQGGKVVISSRKSEECSAVAAQINTVAGREAAVPISANISLKDDLHNLVSRTVELLGRVDVLVCNAASNPAYGPMSQVDDAQFQKLFEANILSTHRLIQLVSSHMVEQKSGSIIVMSSIGGQRGSKLIGAYNVTKAADLQIVRNMAQELGPHGIRVNAISPGLIKTDFARPLWDTPELADKFRRGSALGRIGEPSDIAGAAVFLAADESSFVTGHNLVVDGGVTIVGD